MKIIKVTPDLNIDRLYCTSTGETIFSPRYKIVNTNALAFIAWWMGGKLEEPVIKDEKLQNAWDTFFSGWKNNSSGMELQEATVRFLHEYQNENWMVYECRFAGTAHGPLSAVAYYVVASDTVIETGPDHIDDIANIDTLGTVHDFLESLSNEQREALLRHFNMRYQEKHGQLTDDEKKIVYLAWLYKKGMVKKGANGFDVFNELEARAQLSDYEEIYYWEGIYFPGSYHLESLHMEYQIDRIMQIL